MIKLPSFWLSFEQSQVRLFINLTVFHLFKPLIFLTLILIFENFSSNSSKVALIEIV